MHRRSVLAVASVALSGAVAGCTSFLRSNDEDEPVERYLSVYNLSDDAVEFRIRIGSRPGSVFHTETVELDGETGDERITFEGIPGSLTISVGSTDRWEFPWPVEHGGSQAAAEGANIYYDPLGDQQLIVQA